MSKISATALCATVCVGAKWYFPLAFACRSGRFEVGSGRSPVEAVVSKCLGVRARPRLGWRAHARPWPHPPKRFAKPSKIHTFRFLTLLEPPGTSPERSGTAQGHLKAHKSRLRPPSLASKTPGPASKTQCRVPREQICVPRKHKNQ